jgi:hypothetical protein
MLTIAMVQGRVLMVIVLLLLLMPAILRQSLQRKRLVQL